MSKQKTLISEKPEILEIVEKVIKRDKKAQDKFYKQYERMVKKIVYNFICKHNGGNSDTIISAEDCEQEVWCYLYANMHKYNPERSMVSTYIYLMANACLIRYKENNGRQMRLPVYKTQLFNRIKKYMFETESNDGFIPDEETIKEKFKIDHKELLQFYDYVATSISLERNVGDSENDISLLHLVEGNEDVEKEVFSTLVMEEMREKIINTPSLKDKQKRIADLWLFEEKVDTDICEILGIKKTELSAEKRKIKLTLRNLLADYNA